MGDPEGARAQREGRPCTDYVGKGLPSFLGISQTCGRGEAAGPGVGSEVLVGVLVGVLVLVVVLVELEGQGPGRAPCSHHLRATLGIQVA